MPADYLAGAPDAAVPQPWTDADVVSIAGLIGGIFGKGGGTEIDELPAAHVPARPLGATAGLRAYRELNNAERPAGADDHHRRRFPYEHPGPVVAPRP